MQFKEETIAKLQSCVDKYTQLNQKNENKMCSDDIEATKMQELIENLETEVEDYK